MFLQPSFNRSFHTYILGDAKYLSQTHHQRCPSRLRGEICALTAIRKHTEPICGIASYVVAVLTRCMQVWRASSGWPLGLRVSHVLGHHECKIVLVTIHGAPQLSLCHNRFSSGSSSKTYDGIPLGSSICTFPAFQLSEIENQKPPPQGGGRRARIANHTPYKTTVCIKTKENQ
jgi:hypothetical protein